MQPPSCTSGGKYHSCLYDRPGDTKLVSNEWYAHTALDEAIGVRGDLMSNI